MKNTVSLVMPFRSFTENEFHGIIKVLNVNDPILGHLFELLLVPSNRLLLLNVVQVFFLVTDERLRVFLLILVTLRKIEFRDLEIGTQVFGLVVI